MLSGRIRRILTRVPGVIAFDDWLARRYNKVGRVDPGARGNYNSPLPDLDEVRRRQDELFRQDLDEIPAIDMRGDSQLVFARFLAPYAAECDYLNTPSPLSRYVNNCWFPLGDATTLAAILRHSKPCRVIEVGSGYSSAVILDVCEQHLPNTKLTFIDPRPERLKSILKPTDSNRVEIHETEIQSMSLDKLTALEAGDILFIDSSHISRIGSDVNFLLFEVLPRLQAGVIIHFHDIFWPFEYPIRWILDGFAWNEAYILRSFLQFNKEFEILLFNDYLITRHRNFVETHLPQLLVAQSGCFWLRKSSAN